MGSTGSVGVSALDIVGKMGLEVTALVAGKNDNLMERQARRFKPKFAAMRDENAAKRLKISLADTETQVLSGEEGVIAAAAEKTDICLNSIVGIAGLRPTLEALSACKRLALANKETLVCAGELVLKTAAANNVEVIPVDSEHSAIFQCLQGPHDSEVEKLILTASGGPFFGKTRAELEKITASDALKHPNWDMGAKITIDSATLMNKGLEFIEAMHLFRVSADKIEIVVHRESIIHSMVQFCDGSVLAQMGLPDMRIPIQYAITYPDRIAGAVSAPRFGALGSLSFCSPDMDTFRCLKLAIDCANRGNAACVALNGSNEAAVAGFLRDEIGFLDIYELVAAAVKGLSSEIDIAGSANIDRIFEIDAIAREFVRARISERR